MPFGTGPICRLLDCRGSVSRDPGGQQEVFPCAGPGQKAPGASGPRGGWARAPRATPCAQAAAPPALAAAERSGRRRRREEEQEKRPGEEAEAAAAEAEPLGGGCSAGRPGQSCTPSSPRGDSVPAACCTECRRRPRGGGEERRRGSFGADSDAEWEETALGSSNPVTGGVLTSVVSESWLASQAVRAAEPAADRIAQKWRHRRRTTNRSLVCVCTCLGGKQEKVQKNKK
ncbi:Hypothetical predicted protein [Marmota monax]|uniref:Uncharacterized protein n=1 Tax=Marmota monax TaxID=9995 RepID=A0A5E4C5A5_MARMO|nr:Hypothetical predicted protein [Marmota monax]